ncbi:ketopantoate reductase PanE/ApbA C terminal-domain-containing protein [Pyronema domesticum]|nr:ketopantoate reductase PanE/ApbA C terminal-domain-containing protein [Pyronema domesticum]
MMEARPTNHIIMDLDRELNILFLGGGSIGAIYASCLSRFNCRITIAVRSTYPIVSSRGYNITSSVFGNHTFKPARVISGPSDLSPSEVFDYIIITTKATPGHIPLIGYPVSPNTTLILIQNGIGVEAPYLEAYPQNALITGVAYIIASQPSPGDILQTGENMHLLFGHYPGREIDDPIHHPLIERFNASGCTTTLKGDIQLERWRKLLFNGCFATVCAATGLNTGPAIKHAGALIRELGHEIAAVAKAEGYIITAEEVEGFFDGMWHLDMAPSMLQDCRKRIDMETEVLCGNMVKIAEKHGVEVHRMRTMYMILEGINIRFRLEREKERAEKL